MVMMVMLKIIKGHVTRAVNTRNLNIGFKNQPLNDDDDEDDDDDDDDDQGKMIGRCRKSLLSCF